MERKAVSERLSEHEAGVATHTQQRNLEQTPQGTMRLRVSSQFKRVEFERRPQGIIRIIACNESSGLNLTVDILPQEWEQIVEFLHG